MKKLAQELFRYAMLTVLTAAACMVMWWVSRKDIAVASQGQAGTAPPSAAAAPMPGVQVARIPPELTELTIKYSGKIRPWETYSLGFEIGGRVQSLGVDERGNPLDEGAAISAGQVLAQLDDRILRAQRSETIAQQEKAASDLNRARSLRDRGGRQAITDAEYQEFLTELALAKARQEIASKNLEDAVLRSPVDGRISKRMVEAGESVNAHAVIFEVVENQDVLLVVDVPESRVRELQLRAQAVQRARSQFQGADPESAVFRARVTLEGRDLYGRPWPSINAEVYRIAQVADERTGLFEVEIRIPNADGLLRPGMVATAEIVTDRLVAYRVPETAVTFRGRDAFVFDTQTESTPVEAMFWTVGQTQVHRARRIDLDQWIEQGRDVLLPATAVDLGPVVTRGQQRISDGQLVRVTNADSAASEGNTEMTARRLPEVDNPEVN